MTRLLSVRFDVDTHRCVREGMPALSELGRRLDVPFTFFVNMGRAVSRRSSLLVGRGGPRPPGGATAAKLSARTKLGTRGWLEAALLNPPVGAGSPNVLREARSAGHEIGLHGGRNHARWQRSAHLWSGDRFAEELDAVLPSLRGALGGAGVTGFASPGWTTSPALPPVLRERGFEYLADLHGPGEQPAAAGGLPVVRTQLTGEPGGVAYLEHLRAVGLDDDAVAERFVSDLMAAGDRVALYDHPYHAGIRELETLSRIIESARAAGYELVSMATLARSLGRP